MNQNKISDFYNFYFETLPYGVIFVGEGDIILHINKKCADFLDFQYRDSLIGIQMNELVQLIRKLVTNKNQLDEILSHSIKHTKMIYGTEFELINGRVIAIDIIPFTSNGESVGDIWQIRDISLKKKIESVANNETTKFKEMINSAPVAMAMLDVELKYIAGSKKWCLDFQIEHDDLEGKSIRESIPAISKKWVEVYQRALNGEVLSSQEDYIELKNENKVYIRWAVSPWYRQDNSIGGIIITTDQINELVAQREQALKTAKLKSEFLANMSHEVRTPMNGVFGVVELLKQTKLTEEQLRYLDIITTSADSLMTILNDILDFSKIDAGKLEIEKTYFDVFREIHNSVDMFKYSAQKKYVQLETHITQSVPKVVCTDPVRLKQIIQNLTSNAVKFTKDGHVYVNVNYHKESELTGNLIIDVEDTGVGISKKSLSKIFDAFTQADGSTTREFGGTGLGLTIAQRLVKLLGGQITVKSEAGVGTTFTVILPVTLTEDQIDFAKEIPVEINENFHKKKILIVEDNHINQQVIMSFLKNIGCDIDLAENGIEAMSLTETNKYDVVLMDCQMPVMDGYEATREIRSREKETGQHLYIIAVTAHALNSEIEKCKIVGMDDYVSKPINMSNLKNALNRALQIQAEHNDLVEDRSLKPKFAYVDLNALKDLDLATAKANPKLILRLIEMFSESIEIKRNEMTEGLRTLDFKIISARAHNLKSESGNLGCTKLSKLSGEIENLCAIQDKQSINNLYPDFLNEIDNCVKELTEIKLELESGNKPWAA